MSLFLPSMQPHTQILFDGGCCTSFGTKEVEKSIESLTFAEKKNTASSLLKKGNAASRVCVRLCQAPLTLCTSHRFKPFPRPIQATSSCPSFIWKPAEVRPRTPSVELKSAIVSVEQPPTDDESVGSGLTKESATSRVSTHSGQVPQDDTPLSAFGEMFLNHHCGAVFCRAKMGDHKLVCFHRTDLTRCNRVGH